MRGQINTLETNGSMRELFRYTKANHKKQKAIIERIPLKLHLNKKS